MLMPPCSVTDLDAGRRRRSRQSGRRWAMCQLRHHCVRTSCHCYAAIFSLLKSSSSSASSLNMFMWLTYHEATYTTPSVCLSPSTRSVQPRPPHHTQLHPRILHAFQVWRTVSPWQVHATNDAMSRYSHSVIHNENNSQVSILIQIRYIKYQKKTMPG